MKLFREVAKTLKQKEVKPEVDRIKRKVLFDVFLVLAALVIVGCAESGAADNESQSSESPGGNDVTTVDVAVENDSNPLSFTDDEGELDGYEVEVIEQLDEVLEDYEFNIESVSAEASQIGLDSGKYGFVGGGSFRTEEREEKYLIPEETNGASLIKIYVRADETEISTLDDLVGKKVAPVTPNGGIYNLLTTYNEEHPDSQIDIEPNDSVTSAERFQGVDEGTYDAVVQPSNLGFEEIKEQLGLDVVEIKEPVRVNGTYFLVAQSETELNNAINEGLAQLKEEGILQEIAEKWYGEDIFQYELTED